MKWRDNSNSFEAYNLTPEVRLGLIKDFITYHHQEDSIEARDAFLKVVWYLASQDNNGQVIIPIALLETSISLDDVTNIRELLEPNLTNNKVDSNE